MATDNNQNTDAMEEYEADILTLEDENGNEFQFEVIDVLDHDGKQYMAVVPYTEDPEELVEEDANIIIMAAAEVDGERYVDVVDDDEELITVSKMFEERLQDLYDIDLSDITKY